MKTNKNIKEAKKIASNIALKALNEINITEYTDVIGGILNISDLNQVYQAMEQLKSFIKTKFK